MGVRRTSRHSTPRSSTTRAPARAFGSDPEVEKLVRSELKGKGLLGHADRELRRWSASQAEWPRQIRDELAPGFFDGPVDVAAKKLRDIAYKERKRKGGYVSIDDDAYLPARTRGPCGEKDSFPRARELEAPIPRPRSCQS